MYIRFEEICLKYLYISTLWYILDRWFDRVALYCESPDVLEMSFKLIALNKILPMGQRPYKDEEVMKEIRRKMFFLKSNVNLKT